MAVSHWAEIIETNVSTANNTSTVTLRVHLVTSGESYNYNEQLGNTYIYTPGENKFWRRYTLPPNTDTKIDSVIEGVAHNNDGSKTISWSYSLPTGISAGTVTGSGTTTLTTIPRKTSITSFTVSKVNETTLKFNWQTADTVDYAWYSTNNGSTWTGIDVTDGTSGNFNVGNLSPGQSYNCKIKVRRKDSQLESDPSPTVAQSTYAAPTISLYSKTETTVTVKWGLDTAASHLWYSTNNGSSWVDVGAVSTKVGDITISGLTANTPYNIKVKLRRASSNTDYPSATLAVTTYDYPKVSGVGTSNLLIGDTQALTLYNPLSRSVTVKMYKNNTSGTELYSGTASGTSISFTPVLSTLYASIPNATSSNCVYSVIYGNSTKTTTQYTYSIRGTETPIFSNFTYADTNYASKTGNNQVLVQGLSNLRVTISNENKMIARHSASGNKYTAACENRSGQVNYSSTESVTIDLGTIDTSGTKAISVSAYDSRNLYTTVIQEALVVPYSKPTIVSSATRLNNFENQTTLKVNGIFSKVTVNEVDKNTITNVKYRVREVGGEWGSLTAITFTTNDNKYTCSNVTLDLDNTKSFEIEVQTTDTMEQVTTSSVIVNIGIPSFFIKKTGGFESYGDSEIGGALSVSGNLTVEGRTESQQGFSVIQLSGGSGTSGYMYVCDLTITSQYQDQWIIFNTLQRNRFGKIYMRFQGGGTTDPTLRSFVKTGTNDFRAFIVKANTSTWSIYIQKSESYDNIEITGIEKGRYANGIQITWKNTTASAVPTGYTEAIIATINMEATNASKLGTSTVGSTDRPIYLNGGTPTQCNTPASGNYFRGVPFISSGGVMEVGRYIDFHPTNGSTADYTKRIDAGTGTTARTLTIPDHSGTVQVRPTNLYNNASGTTGTITLSQSAANFNYIEVFYIDSYTRMSSQKIYSPNGRGAQLSSFAVFGTSRTASGQTACRKFNGTAFNVDGEVGNWNGWNNGYDTANTIKVIRVDGWL